MAVYYFRNAGTDWNTSSNWSLTDGGGATGAVPTSADDAYFTSQSGSCTISTASRTCKTLIFSGVGSGDYSNTFTLNNTLTVSGNVTLSATMTFAGTSTLTINALSQITTNGKVFTCNLSTSGTITVSLNGDAYVSGNYTIGGASGAITTLTGSALYVAGNITGTGTILSSSSDVIMNGTGTLSVTSFNAQISGSGAFVFDTTGTITINNTTFVAGASGKYIRYISGTVVLPRGQTLTLYTTNSGVLSLELKGVQISGSVSMGTQGSISLVTDFVLDGGTMTFGNSSLSGSQPLVVNSAGGNLYLGLNALPLSISTGSSNLTSVSGTATIYIKGGGTGTFSVYPAISNNIVFDFSGILKFVNGSLLGTEQAAVTLTTGTYTFLNGRVTSESLRGVKNQGRLSINGSGTFLGFDKMSGIGNISISNGLTLTMDKFFSGRPDCISNIVCATATGAYTVTFQDTFEKLANWVRVSNCTLSRRGQLLILNQKAVNNTARNTGVRYINTWPNGVAKDSPFTPGQPMAYGAGGLLSDPAIAL